MAQVRSDIFIALRLLNAARFSTGIAGATASVRRFHQEVDAASTATERWAATSNLGQAALFSLGTGVKLLSGTVATLTAATAYYGIQFNATMESNQLAFTQFAGSAASAKKFTQDLFKIAAETPFSFEDITTAGRRLLAFGFNIQETTDLLKVMGDTISFTGGSTDEILRLGKALGDIRAKGKLMQQEMNQLANVGIPIRDILAKGGLELTQKQLSNIGRAGIPAADAINAIRTGLQLTYGGGAQKYLQTFNGQLQRLRDNLKSAAGAATVPLFNALKRDLGDVNKRTDNLRDYFNGPKWQKLSGKIGSGISTGIKFLVSSFGDLWEALKPAKPFWDNVLGPFLKGLAVGLGTSLVAGVKGLVIVVRLFATALGFLGKILKPLKPLFYGLGLIISLFFGGAILKVLGFLGKFSRVFRVLEVVVGAILIPFKLFGMVLGTVAKLFVGTLTRGFYFFLNLLGKFSPTLQRIIDDLLVFGTTLRTNLVNLFTRALLGLAKLPGFVGRMFLKVGIAIGDFLFKGMKERIAKIFLGAVGLAAGFGKSLRDWLNKNTLFGNEIKIGPIHTRIPKLAKGGFFSGAALVGEEGPELAQHTAKGTMITPLRGKHASARNSGAYATGKMFDGFRAYFEIPLYLDKHGKVKLAEAMGEYVGDRRSVA